MTLYNKIISGGKDRRLNNSAVAAGRTDGSLSDGMIKFTECFKNITRKKEHKIPLRFWVSSGLVDRPIKFDTKFIFILDTDMNRLFETNI